MKNHEFVRLVWVLLLAFGLLNQISNAQDTKPEPCPDATIVGPAADLKENESGEYSLIVDSKGFVREMSFVWEPVGGEVVDGQGAVKAKIKRTGEDFLVSVHIKGLRPRCESEFSEKRPDFTPPEAILLSRIDGNINEGDEDKAKNFVGETRIDRKHVFWVIIASRKKDGVENLAGRRQALLDLFDKYGRFGEDARITFVNLEADEEFIELWKTTANTRPSILDK